MNDNDISFMLEAIRNGWSYQLKLSTGKTVWIGKHNLSVQEFLHLADTHEKGLLSEEALTAFPGAKVIEGGELGNGAKPKPKPKPAKRAIW